jgi:hypothetical protein
MPALNEVYLVDGASGGGGGLVLSTRRVNAQQFITSTTSSQNWFSSNGIYTFSEIGMYHFMGELRWSVNTGSHTLSIGFDLGGTGSHDHLRWQAITNTGTGIDTSPQTSTQGRYSVDNNMRTVSSSTNAGGIVRLTGSIRITTLTRTLAPLLAFSSGSVSAPSVLAGSYFQVWKISDDPNFTTDAEWS